MKLWLISQTANHGYDTYDSAIVAAETEGQAKSIHPGGYVPNNWAQTGQKDKDYGSWTSKSNVKCKYIGDAAPEVGMGVICASFNAG